MVNTSKKLGLILFVLTGCGLVIVPVVYLLYIDQRRSYWDQRVIEYCEKDAGVSVYEVVRIGTSPLERNDFLLHKRSEGDSTPYKTIKRETVIHERNPRVIRIQWDYLRVSSNKLLGTMVSYYRYGGDAWTIFTEPSRFSCTDMGTFAGLSDGLIFIDGPYDERLERVRD